MHKSAEGREHETNQKQAERLAARRCPFHSGTYQFSFNLFACKRDDCEVAIRTADGKPNKMLRQKTRLIENSFVSQLRRHRAGDRASERERAKYGVSCVGKEKTAYCSSMFEQDVARMRDYILRDPGNYWSARYRNALARVGVSVEG